MQNKLLEKFFQAAPGKEASGALGFGLGLAISKLIVEHHKGQIGVVSEPGKGSMFWFDIAIDEGT